jgi:hypothetical protein
VSKHINDFVGAGTTSIPGIADVKKTFERAASAYVKQGYKRPEAISDLGRVVTPHRIEAAEKLKKKETKEYTPSAKKAKHTFEGTTVDFPENVSLNDLWELRTAAWYAYFKMGKNEENKKMAMAYEDAYAKRGGDVKARKAEAKRKKAEYWAKKRRGGRRYKSDDALIDLLKAEGVL